MTSPNATGVHDLLIQVASVPDSIHAGLRLEWVTASDDDLVAILTSGAGCGSTYMTLQITRPDLPTIYETVDVRDFLPAWIEQALARAATPTPVCPGCGLTRAEHSATGECNYYDDFPPERLHSPRADMPDLCSYDDEDWPCTWARQHPDAYTAPEEPSR